MIFTSQGGEKELGKPVDEEEIRESREIQGILGRLSEDVKKLVHFVQDLEEDRSAGRIAGAKDELIKFVRRMIKE